MAIQVKQLIVVGVAVVLTGCMSVNEGMLRKVNILPPQNQVATVEVKTGELIQKLNGEGQNSGVLSGTTVLNAVAKSMMIRWKRNDIISDFGFSGELKKEPDYTITLSGVRNEDSSILGSAVSGLGLLIIPTSQTLTYDLNIEFVNNHTQKNYNVKAKNAVTTWMQIFLIPALPFSWVGSNNMINDIADYSYDELRKQGAFEIPTKEKVVSSKNNSTTIETVDSLSNQKAKPAVVPTAEEELPAKEQASPKKPTNKPLPKITQEISPKSPGVMAFEAEAAAMKLGCVGNGGVRPASILMAMESNIERYQVSCVEGVMYVQCESGRCDKERY